MFEQSKLPFRSKPPYLLIILLILPFISHVSSQVCQKTDWNPSKTHPCPLFTREAFTLQKPSPSGPSYIKLCCADRGSLAFAKASAKACRTTTCVLPSEFHSTPSGSPCSTLAKVLVDGQSISHEETMRDSCVQETTNEKGVTGVCCPPNSEAGFLMSAYGAELNEFPHQARVQSGSELCGGTVYSKRFVITAAHCVVEDGVVKSPSDTHVVLGSNIATISSKTNFFPVKRVIVHDAFSLKRGSPQFSRFPFPPRRIFNDVALLELERPINFRAQSNIRALPLAPPNFTPSQYSDHVVIVGWGVTDNGLTTHHLQKANLLIRRDDQCFKPLIGGYPYANMREFSNQLLCVGGLLNGQFSPVAGRGDSGGPAICRGPGGYAVLCGITSFGGDGDTCSEFVDEESCRPTAYADVSYFRDWIKRNAGEQEREGLLKVKLYGDPVPNWQYDHQVHISSYGGPNCGGTLVSPDTVVTAGHCVLWDNGQPRGGISVTTRQGWDFKVRNGGVHRTPYYSRLNLFEKLNQRKSRKRAYLNAPFVEDIAVLKLSKRVPISAEKLPKLPLTTDLPINSEALELSIPLPNNPSQKQRLSERTFRILDSRECQRRMDKLTVMSDQVRWDNTKNFCGVEVYSGGGICDRESGGGLICKGRGDEEVFCGVQTFRLCDMSMPSVFLNVGGYRPMIEQVINKQ